MPLSQFWWAVCESYPEPLFSLRCAAAQMSSTTRPFAQWNIILTHLQHSKFNIVYISHSAFTAWNASLFVCLQSCAIACAKRPTFSQCKYFLERTLSTTVWFDFWNIASVAMIYLYESGFSALVHVKMQTLNHEFRSWPYGCKVKGRIEQVHEIKLPFEI